MAYHMKHIAYITVTRFQDLSVMLAHSASQLHSRLGSTKPWYSQSYFQQEQTSQRLYRAYHQVHIRLQTVAYSVPESESAFLS